MEDITIAIESAFRSLLLSLCDIVYRLIVFFFDIFNMLGTAKILENETIQSFYQHIGLILGLFMVFRITFSAIQYVINPDNMLDKSKGIFNIVKNVFIVIVLLGITPSLFNWAFDIQKLIVKENIIPRIIMNSTNSSISVDESAGDTLAWYAFSSFYQRNLDVDSVGTKCPDVGVYGEESNLARDFKINGTFRLAYNCVNMRDKYETNSGFTNTNDEEYVIKFEGIMCLLVGCIILWMIVMYTIQVGVRVIQLAYLQLIAPVPIMMYLTPKGEDRLNKWVKQCTSTYFDFFLRTAIIYFVVYVINVLIANDNNYFIQSLGELGDVQHTWITIVMIIALLLFAKKVPDLFKELFPSSGGASKFSFGLNPKKELNNTWAAGLIGGAAGALGAGASNAVHGFMNMRKAWNENKVDEQKFRDDRWEKLTDEQKKTDLEERKAHNAMRRAQMVKRAKAVAGAAGKSALSVAGGVAGGAKAGIKTTDITKAGEAVKTANANREKREQRVEAGYHWYDSLGDKVLEFAGETEAIEVAKNRQKALIDARAKDDKFNRGAETASRAVGSDGKLNPDVAFNSSEFKESYKKVAKAKANLRIADNQLTQAQANLNAAYNYTGSDLEIKPGENKEEKIAKTRNEMIAKANEIIEQAKKNSKAMEGQLELAKAEHDTNRKIYINDAQIEDDFKYYNDIKEIENGYKEIKELKFNSESGSSVSQSDAVDTMRYSTTAQKLNDANQILAKLKSTGASNDQIKKQENIVLTLNKKLEIAKKITEKEQQISAQEDVMDKLNQDVANAIATKPGSDEVNQLRIKYQEEDKKNDILYNELGELEEQFNNVDVSSSTMVNGNNDFASGEKKQLKKKEVRNLRRELARLEIDGGNPHRRAEIENILKDYE